MLLFSLLKLSYDYLILVTSRGATMVGAEGKILSFEVSRSQENASTGPKYIWK